jgi:hypothetical protein
MLELGYGVIDRALFAVLVLYFEVHQPSSKVAKSDQEVAIIASSQDILRHT